MKRLAPPRRSAAVQVVGPHQWILFPALIALLATWLFAAPIRVFGLSLPEPIFPLVLAFAWPLIRPSILAPLMLLLVGVAIDLFWGGLLGLWALCLLMSYGVVLVCRSLISGQSTLILFGWYAGVSIFAFCLGLLVVSLSTGQAPAVLPVLLQWLPTVLLFPAVNWLLDRFDAQEVRFK